jgi:REP element-mobilizing transposase RayT
MPKVDTLHKPYPRSSLQDLLMRVRDAGIDSTQPLLSKPTEQSTKETKRTDSRPPVAERRRQKIYHDPASAVILEQVDRHPYDLSYACLLIPRFSSHLLIGDIAESLHDWMKTICLSFAWRLENLYVRPDYMQWVLYVPAATPPSRCIRTVREHTSRQIFEDFPLIKQQNLSKDFWAPGYLVIMGPAPHPREMIDQYIRLTRQQQGPQLHSGG